MIGDYVLIVCRRCGERMLAAKGSRVCRTCQMGSCADATCRKHDRWEFETGLDAEELHHNAEWNIAGADR